MSKNKGTDYLDLDIVSSTDIDMVFATELDIGMGQQQVRLGRPGTMRRPSRKPSNGGTISSLYTTRYISTMGEPSRRPGTMRRP